MMFRRNLPALRLTILVVVIHLLVVLAFPIFLGAFFGAKLPGSTPTVLAAFIPVLYIGFRLVKNHRLDRAALFVLPLLTTNLILHAAKGQPLMTPLLLTGVGLAWVNALLLRRLLTSQAWAAPLTSEKSPPLDAVGQHQLARMSGGRPLPFFPFLIDVLALTLFLVALGWVLFSSFLPGLSMPSLLFLTWGVVAIAVLLLIGPEVWHRIPHSGCERREESLQERGCKSTLL